MVGYRIGMLELIHEIYNVEQLIKTVGLIGITAIVFAESGLLIGFFLPGDSLLFTAGLLSSTGIFNIHILALFCFIAAVLGDSVGYAFGHKVGRRLFQKEESFFFHKKNLIRAENFYKKHGKKTIILARFMPFIRTFAPIVAGIGSMNYPTFLSYNVIGGLLWAVGLTYAGFFLGKLIPDIDKYLLPIIFLIVFLSILPGILHFMKDKGTRDEVFSQVLALAKRIVK